LAWRFVTGRAELIQFGAHIGFPHERFSNQKSGDTLGFEVGQRGRVV
jgi:hypothetical protein